MKTALFLTALYILGDYNFCWLYYPDQERWHPEPVDIKYCLEKK